MIVVPSFPLGGGSNPSDGGNFETPVIPPREGSQAKTWDLEKAHASL